MDLINSRSTSKINLTRPELEYADGETDGNNLQRQRSGSVTGQLTSRLTGAMDLLWTSLRRGWANKIPTTKTFKIENHRGPTYCTAYHRLVTGEQEIFCDELNYEIECDSDSDNTEHYEETKNISGSQDCDVLTPDSGAFCDIATSTSETGSSSFNSHPPGSEEEIHKDTSSVKQSESKIKKSTSLQFPMKNIRMSISRSLNFSLFQSSSKEEDFEEEDEEDDYDWDDEALTCNVCDRSFETPRQLERHQIRKRHWGCSECDTLFNSLMDLEHHKEALQHWSEDDDDDDDEDSDVDYDYYFDGGGGRIYVEESDQECDCGCGGRDQVETEEEETEFGPDKAEMEMLL